MIPSSVIRLGTPRQSDWECVVSELESLGIPPDGEFAEISKRYILTMFLSETSYEQLIDLCWPNRDIAGATSFVRQVWQLPDDYIPFTSCEGEGCYLYNRIDGTIWDFSLADRDGFISGKSKPMFNSFYEFMDWYLSPDTDAEPSTGDTLPN